MNRMMPTTPPTYIVLFDDRFLYLDGAFEACLGLHHLLDFVRTSQLAPQEVIEAGGGEGADEPHIPATRMHADTK